MHRTCLGLAPFALEEGLPVALALLLLHVHLLEAPLALEALQQLLLASHSLLIVGGLDLQPLHSTQQSDARCWGGVLMQLLRASHRFLSMGGFDRATSQQNTDMQGV
jgi:hypothetical protein